MIKISVTKQEAQWLWAQILKLEAVAAANPPRAKNEPFEIKDKDGNLLFSGRYETIRETLSSLSKQDATTEMGAEPRELKFFRKTLRVACDAITLNKNLLDNSILPEYDRRVKDADPAEAARLRKYRGEAVERRAFVEQLHKKLERGFNQ